jgi:hypothetical protein
MAAILGDLSLSRWLNCPGGAHEGPRDSYRRTRDQDARTSLEIRGRDVAWSDLDVEPRLPAQCGPQRLLGEIDAELVEHLFQNERGSSPSGALTKAAAARNSRMSLTTVVNLVPVPAPAIGLSTILRPRSGMSPGH